METLIFIYFISCVVIYIVVKHRFWNTKFMCGHYYKTIRRVRTEIPWNRFLLFVINNFSNQQWLITSDAIFRYSYLSPTPPTSHFELTFHAMNPHVLRTIIDHIRGDRDIIYFGLIATCLAFSGLVQKKIQSVEVKKWSGTCLGLFLIFVVMGSHVWHFILATIVGAFLSVYTDKRYFFREKYTKE